jgi:hypothetical protein
MNSRQFQELQEAYMNVYQEIDEANRGEQRLGRKGLEPTLVRANRNLSYSGGDSPDLKSDDEMMRKNPRYVSGHRRGGQPNLASDNSSRIQSHKEKRGVKTKGTGVREEVDLYDIILSHLIDEGYASTEEAATAIMANMSEDWRDSVVEAYKDLPADKMIRKAGVKQFKHGMSVGSGNASNPKVAQQVGKMSAVALLHDPERVKAKSKMKKD